MLFAEPFEPTSILEIPRPAKQAGIIRIRLLSQLPDFLRHTDFLSPRSFEFLIITDLTLEQAKLWHVPSAYPIPVPLNHALHSDIFPRPFYAETAENQPLQ